MAMVMPRSRSSGALSIWSKGVKATFGLPTERTLVMAAVRVVFPWSMCPMVPTFMCSLVRSNLALAMAGSSSASWALASRGAPAHPGDDLLGDARGDGLVPRELHGVGRPALRGRAQVRGVTEHLRQGDL